jgi:PiT family inorganic phosphate transporter
VLIALAFAAVGTAFVFVCGANDGGTLLSLALRHRSVPEAVVLGMVGVAIVLGPNWFGLAVARTFTHGLLGAGGRHTDLIVLAGATVAVLLVLGLTWRGLPTSMTLAVLGALAGAGTGLGSPPVWATLARVLTIGALAPLVGGVLGYLLGTLADRFPRLTGMPRAVRLGHVAAFCGQCLAYAANDGQKMFAVGGVALAVAHGTDLATAIRPSVGLQLAIAVVFTAGAVLSLRRVARGASGRLIAARPWQVVSAEVACSAAVLGTASLGVPVSMTQSVAGGLAGAGASQGLRRVRWQFALPMIAAWLVTLPASFTAGLAAGLLLRGVTP